MTTSRAIPNANLRAEAHLEPLKKSELILLLLLAGVNFTHIMDFMILMPLGPQLMRIFNIEPREFGFLVSAYNFAAGAAGFLGAFFLDRFDRKKALLAAYAGFTVGTLACALAPTYLFLVTARSLAGVFGGVLGAIVMSIVSDSIPSVKRGRAMGLIMASFSVASVFGVPMGLFLANHFNWHAPFLFVGIAAALIGFVLFFVLPAMNSHKTSVESRPTPVHVLARVAQDSNQLRALGLTVLMMFGQFLIIPFLSPTMVSNGGLREDQLPLIYMFGGGLTIFTSPWIGRMSDRFGRAQMFLIFTVLILIPYGLLTQMSRSSLAYILSITTMFFVVSNGRFVPAWAMITSTVKAEARGSFLSLNSCVQSIASGTAAFSASLIVSKGQDGVLMNFDKVGYISIAIGLVASFVGIKLLPVKE